LNTARRDNPVVFGQIDDPANSSISHHAPTDSVSHPRGLRAAPSAVPTPRMIKTGLIAV
jgi:hypothetical protein